MNKKFLAGLLIGALVLPTIGIATSTTVEAKSAKATVTVEQTIDNRSNEKGQPPEPPKDENGNPLPPPDMKNRDGQSEDQSGNNRSKMRSPRRSDQSGDDQSGARQRPPRRSDQSNENGQPPEPPKDENGNPLPPPDDNSDRSDQNRPDKNRDRNK